ncbi:MAG: threonine ammonia-lyase [Desulfarculus sp.]|nr:threonine ammonia-lyase [Desulfarculus sp.]
MADILAARQRLAGVAFHTPLAPAPHLGQLVGAELHLKLENLQRTGSFKMRGAYNRLSLLASDRPGAKVVAASAGNHAQGVAVSAGLLGLQALIFMPRGASLSKRQATLGAGAQLRLEGESVADCLAAARALEPGYTFIHPYDDLQVIAGQGSLGLEILEDLPDAQAVLVPVGGGGLIAGVAMAIKERRPSVRVIGVEPIAAASVAAALKAGEPVRFATRATLADGARVARAGELALPLIQRYVDDMVAVEEDHIAQAMVMLIEGRRVVAEGAGALGLAAFMAGVVPGLAGQKVVLLISGGNVDSNLLGRIIDRGLVQAGRIFRFSAVLPDRPGALAGLLGLLAKEEANVLLVSHDRHGRDLPPDQSRVHLEVETTGPEHAQEMAQVLGQAGYQIFVEP